MKNKPIKTLILKLILLFLILSNCIPIEEIKDFVSDGCSLFPDRNLITKKDWCECCFKHDIAYWQGGTEKQRLLADQKLRDCVIEKTGDQILANTMYHGVRFGGSPYFYNWYRWGYGWSFKRKYQSLTKQEEKTVEKKLKKYFSIKGNNPCN